MSEIPSATIGELVMEGLKQLDDVAYVRFASVYRNFREPKDFEKVLDELQGEGAGTPHDGAGPRQQSAAGGARYPLHGGGAFRLGRRNLGSTWPEPGCWRARRAHGRQRAL